MSMNRTIRLLTPGTEVTAQYHAGEVLRVEADGTAIMRNSRGLFLVGDGTWGGYFRTDESLREALVFLRGLRAETANHRRRMALFPGAQR